MSDSPVQCVAELPRIEEYINFRRALGWGAVGAEAIRKTLDATTFCRCLRAENNELVGLIRIVGDGVLYLFIADVMVHPDCTGRGLGEQLMMEAVKYIEESADPWATVTLVPLAGRESFYEQFGFSRCPNEVFGHGMAYMRHLAL